MGRFLGAFDEDNDNDRPELNRCPDCGCFFAQDECPLCGKVCPEEMRAGNRKAVKQKKRKRGASRDRVVFMEWYHSWWFILIMCFVMPIAAVILWATSPRSKTVKTVGVVVMVAVYLVSSIGIGTIIGAFSGLVDPPVNTSLSEDEYKAKCDEVAPKDFYRSPDDYDGKYVSMTLTVVKKTMDYEAYLYEEEYFYYYLCTDVEGGSYEILVRDCNQGKTVNLMAGDVITVYGEGAGNRSFYDAAYLEVGAPCVNVAYLTFVE